MADIVGLDGKRIGGTEKENQTPTAPAEPEPRTFVVKTVDGNSWEVFGYAGIVPPVVMIGSNDGRIDCIVPISNLHNVTVKEAT
jgi:hypothetical protein